MRALVTGAAGFIGSHLCERLVQGGASVVGLDAFTTYYDPAVKRANLRDLAGSDAFSLVEDSLLEVDFGPLLRDVDVIYHLAAQPGVRRSWGSEFEIYLNENVLATQLLLEAVREAAPTRVVFASSSSVYGDAERFPTAEADPPRPISPYGATKLAGEHLCHLYFSRFAVPVVMLRYFTVYGPRQRPDMAFSRFIAAAGEDREIEIFGDGLQRRDFTFVADVVSASIAAAEHGRPGEAYNIAGGSQATVTEVVATLSELMDREIAVRRVPPVPGDARHTGASIEKAAAELGYSPETALREGLELQLVATGATGDPRDE